MSLETVTIVALIGVAGTVCSIVFGYLGYQRGKRHDANQKIKEVKQETEQDVKEVSELKADTNYIRRRIDDVLLEQRELNKTVNVHAERLTRVEESAKQAHKRIDEHISQDKGRD